MTPRTLRLIVALDETAVAAARLAAVVGRAVRNDTYLLDVDAKTVSVTVVYDGNGGPGYRP